MKNTLLITSKNGRGPVMELPWLLKQAGLHVTLMCGRETRGFISSYHDRWIEGAEEAPALVTQAAALIQQNPAAFDWIIPGDDEFLYALVDAPLDMELKTRMGSVQQTECVMAVGGKIGAAQAARALDIPLPASQPAHSIDEAAKAAAEISFPVMIKIDRSSGGTGVFKCDSPADIQTHAAQLQNQALLVEKFIEGDLISVETLWLEGRLAAYAYSNILHCDGWGVSARRIYQPCPAIAGTLQKLATGLGLHGFGSLGFIRDAKTGQHLLMELDLRTNAWMASTRFAGVDIAGVLANYARHGTLPATPVTNAKETLVSLPHREVRNFIRQKNALGLLVWAINPFYWKFIPFYDPRLIFSHMLRLRSLKALLEKFRLRREKLHPA